MSREAGKGSRQRPFDYDAFSQNYDRIFGKARKPPVQPEEEDRNTDSGENTGG